MKRILLMLMLLSGMSSAIWTNDADDDLLDARYVYVACDVDYAKEWLSMREGCGETSNVPVFDSSEYVSDLEDGLDELEEAADEGDKLGFGLTMLGLGADSLDLLGAILKDASDNKTLKFFQCVRDGEKALKEDRDECRADAMEEGRTAAKAYVRNELDYGQNQTDDLGALGADTSGMEAILDKGDELLDDIDPAFDTKDPKEVRKLHLRHSRLILLFRMEKMLAVMDYAGPIIERSGNSNREEILDEMDSLEEDIGDMTDECAYSDQVDDILDYSMDNTSCWATGIKLFKRFNDIRLLIIGGALR